MKKTLLIIAGALLCGVGPLIVLTGTVYTLMLPNIYESSAVVRIPFPEKIKGQYTEEALVALTQQQAVLTGQPAILYAVIEKLQLQAEWGSGQDKLPRSVALKVLESSVGITADRRAVGLIRISVKRDNPTEAAEIANELALAFREASGGAVTIVQVAEAGYRPVSPDLFLNVLVLTAVAAVHITVGVVLLLSGIKRTRVQSGG